MLPTAQEARRLIRERSPVSRDTVLRIVEALTMGRSDVRLEPPPSDAAELQRLGYRVSGRHVAW